MPKTESQMTMAELLAESSVKALSAGDIVEGEVISKSRNEIWVDLPGYGTGVVAGKELQENSSIIADIAVGDKITASVIETEIEDGCTLLSLRKAAKDRVWDRLEEKKSKEEKLMVKPFDANKGGLLIEVDGVRGFLPVSQLAPEHYPRVSGGDKDEILIKLNSLIHRPLEVIILDVDKKENKLIFSEKSALKEVTKNILSNFEIGQVVKGKVTGVVDFGIFMNIAGVEGLVHISEISWDRVDDVRGHVKVGQELEAKIIGIEKDKISLSLKQLTEDPWKKAIRGFKVNDVVEGKVTRITPFGAFVQIHSDIEALVHITELSAESISAPADVVEIGKSYSFKIISIEPDNRKLALSLKEVKEEKKTKKAKKED
jgi:small subunit ribosomal protein S1